ncbi:FKBP-type peptidyl-prolyl cis-trans isomerase [Luteimonas yindakuii]|uniref:FKBP-type peptidyl-prolyl cis-trans isomerase n=1 Tax=Luteimonas yindakuii TaxID=2565782 RepID=UPI0010A3A91D|nr:FKBP-type peptidyl-prolyl cis-trans isomerase [Luteimonas yindakuii]QCO68421.1 FKBP-type peptidyl-prolyl cis-trans isomerase [Luteimonas yindakuii]
MTVLSLRAALVAGCLAVLAACGGPPPYTGGRVATLERIDLRSGDGETARAGDTVTVHYTGWLYDENATDHRGAAFDSSRKRGAPFEFTLGAGQVIRGWDEGVAGMRVGGQRELRLPPEYGYGERGAGRAIPPGASLVFDVELLGVERP